MNASNEKHALADEDQGLLDLLSGVLVNPDLHTDTRMRLHRQIAELLRRAHGDLYGPAGPEVHARALEAHGDELPDLLRAVLVDPNLHTDLRMRLHREIPEMLRAARESAD